MSKLLSRVATDVKQAGVASGKVEVGYVANKQIVKLIKKTVKPSGFMGNAIVSQLDSPLGEALVGIAAAQALKELRGTDPRVVMLADAMTFSATQEFLRSFDVNGMIDQLLESPEILTAGKGKAEA